MHCCKAASLTLHGQLRPTLHGPDVAYVNIGVGFLQAVDGQRQHHSLLSDDILPAGPQLHHALQPGHSLGWAPGLALQGHLGLFFGPRVLQLHREGMLEF